MRMLSSWWTCSKRKRGQHHARPLPTAKGDCGCMIKPPQTEYETGKKTKARSRRLEGNNGEGVPEPFRGRRPIHRNQAGAEPATTATSGEASSDANEGSLPSQDEP